jgi:hypothetical protein
LGRTSGPGGMTVSSGHGEFGWLRQIIGVLDKLALKLGIGALSWLAPQSCHIVKRPRRPHYKVASGEEYIELTKH